MSCPSIFFLFKSDEEQIWFINRIAVYKFTCHCLSDIKEIVIELTHQSQTKYCWLYSVPIGHSLVKLGPSLPCVQR